MGQQPLRTETWTVTGRTETQGYIKKKTNKQKEVTRPLGQNYAVAKQPGDSSKEPLHGRFPSLREGIHSAVCMHVHEGVCLCEFVS